jgi:electron transfer flavoprotein alpha subunit
MFLYRQFSSLILAEHNNKKLNPIVYSAVNAADYFNDDITVLVAGSNCMTVAEEASKIKGVSKVLHADSILLEHHLPDVVTSVLHSVQSSLNFKRILAASSNFSRDVIPRLGGMLETQPITEITKIMNQDVYKRSAYAGNAIYTVSSVQALRLLTVRSTSFDKNPVKNQASPVETWKVDGLKTLMNWENEEIEIVTRPELASARIVVSGGRGLKNKEGFGLAEQLADALGAGLGASRAAVDAGFCHNDLQVGQTGKIVAPELYVALGISGAIQHLAGMKDSKTIVAINTDPEAPIFSVSDYGLVGDAFKVVPEIISKLKK